MLKNFDHVTVVVRELDAAKKFFTLLGIRLRNQVMDFHQRRLVFVYGPEDVTIELAEWH